MSGFDVLTFGTNQKDSAFWTIIHIMYNRNVHSANKNKESDPDWKNLPDDQLKGSLKIQGYARL